MSEAVSILLEADCGLENACGTEEDSLARRLFCGLLMRDWGGLGMGMAAETFKAPVAARAEDMDGVDWAS